MTELVRRTTGEVDPAEARRLSASRLMPEHIHKDPASVEYMMRIGASLGIDPASAMQHIYVFESKGVLKASISSHLMVALAMAAGHMVHVEGDALKATATLVRKTSQVELEGFRRMREEEQRQKTELLLSMQSLYDIQRKQLLDQIADLKDLALLDEKPSGEEVAALRKRLTELHAQYDFDGLRGQLSETKFDLAKIVRFESVWTMKRANSIEGLTNKGTWQSYGPEMLKSRAKSGVTRDGAPDVILGIKNFMSTLGVAFSGDRDDELAMANAMYTPEELGVPVDESGAPLEGRVLNVTDERENKAHGRMMDRTREMVAKLDSEGILNWSARVAGREDASGDQKTSALQAALAAVREGGKAEDMVEHDGREATLSAHMESLITNLR